MIGKVVNGITVKVVAHCWPKLNGICTSTIWFVVKGTLHFVPNMKAKFGKEHALIITKKVWETDFMSSNRDKQG